MERQIADFEKSVSVDSDMREKYEPLLAQARDLDKKLKGVKASVYNPDIQHNVEEDDIHALADLHGRVEGLAEDLASAYDQPPNALFREQMARVSKELNDRLSAFNNLLKQDVASYNKSAYAAGAPTLFSGGAIAIKPAPGL
jgi:hypothetical protein